jgi:hypothetical protein
MFDVTNGPKRFEGKARFEKHHSSALSLLAAYLLIPPYLLLLCVSDRQDLTKIFSF